MIRSFSGSIARLGGDPLTVTRKRAGYFDQGRYVAPESADEFEIMGSVQPLTPEELQMLPEGQRSDEARKLYTTTELKSGEEPDHVQHCGIDYEVTEDQNWSNAGQYFRYRLVRSGQGNVP